MFLNEFTKGVKVHIEDLVTLMKACVQHFYGHASSAKNQTELENSNEDCQNRTSMAGGSDLESVQNIDFFSQVGRKLRKVGKGLDRHVISQAFAEFDHAEIGYIKAYYLVNVLHRHLPELFSDSEMVGLQYELESLSYDGTVDYNEFIRLFMG